MSVEMTGAVSLTSQWFIKPGCEAEVIEAVTRLTAEVESQQPGTLTSLAVSARPAGSAGNSGGCTSFVEAGLRAITPAALRYSKKERTTESLKQTVAGRFLL